MRSSTRPPPKPWKTEGKGRIAFVPETADYSIIQWLLTHASREHAIVYEVLVTTGLRIAELLSLQPHEVETEWVRLSDTKNGDTRDVPIAPAHAQALRDSIARGRLPGYRSVFDAFVKAGETLSVGVRITPHVLRHTYATRLTTARVPTATVKALLGHKDVRTTLQYAHVDRSALTGCRTAREGRARGHKRAGAIVRAIRKIRDTHQKAIH